MNQPRRVTGLILWNRLGYFQCPGPVLDGPAERLLHGPAIDLRDTGQQFPVFVIDADLLSVMFARRFFFGVHDQFLSASFPKIWSDICGSSLELVARRNVRTRY